MKKLSYLLLGLILACSAPKTEEKTGADTQADSLQNEGDPSQDSLDQSMPALEEKLLEQGLVDVTQVIPGIQVVLK